MLLLFRLLGSDERGRSYTQLSPLSLPERTGAKHQTRRFADLHFIFSPHTLNSSSLSSFVSAKTLVVLCLPPPHTRWFLPYQMTLGLKASCQTWYETWPLLRNVCPPLTPCCAQGPSCVFQNKSLLRAQIASNFLSLAGRMITTSNERQSAVTYLFFFTTRLAFIKTSLLSYKHFLFLNSEVLKLWGAPCWGARGPVRWCHVAKCLF